MKILEADSSNDNEIEQFLLQFEDSTIYHHPGWLELLRRETNQRAIKLIVRDEQDKLIGYLPLLSTKGFPLQLGGQVAKRRFSSLPRTPIGGPVAADDDICKSLIKYAAVNYLSDKKSVLQIKSYSDCYTGIIENLVCLPWRDNFQVEFNSGEELRFGNSRNHSAINRAVKKAIKTGVRTRRANTPEELLLWHRLYLDTMRFHMTPPRSFEFFRDMWQLLSPGKLCHLQLAELKTKDGLKIIAGSVFLYFNKTYFYAFNGSSREFFEYRPNDLLHWEAIHSAKEEGYKLYDLGEVPVDQSGLAAYKSKWANVTKKIFHYYYPLTPQKENLQLQGTGTEVGMLKKLWQYIPLSLTEKIGKIIYKRL